MISYKQAVRTILKNTRALPLEELVIEGAVNKILREDVYSKIDMPPFNKSAMDGYALIAQDTQGAPISLKCIGLIQAGENFKRKLHSGECVKIMTGAPLPEGADSVVMVEEAVNLGKYVKIKGPVSKWQNVCFKAEDIQKGKRILEKNRVISSACIALLATIGRRFVKVTKRPTVTILNTGGEIVPAGKELRPGQIYNSNGPQLMALLKSDGVDLCSSGISEDKPEELMQAVKNGLKSDIFLISGGVSMGDYDLVPSILKCAGVKEIFHKVNIKPGKPLFFGKKAKTLIFGIPGNPVSNFLAYQLFIRPALCKMSGYSLSWPKFEKGFLEKSLRNRPGRTHFILADSKKKGSNWRVDPVVCHGSADVLALSKVNAFIVVGENISYLRAKSKVEILLWEERLII